MYEIRLNDEELYQVREAIKEQIKDVKSGKLCCSDEDEKEIVHTLENVLRQIKEKEQNKQ